MAHALCELEQKVTSCRRCPRLVQWRESVARERRAAFKDEEYWGAPLPGFGDPQARLLVLGLAPAAHGGNRTGRIFTGDRSGDFLFAAMWRAGLASTPLSVAKDDRLELRGAWVTAAVKCAPPANKPTATERDNCMPWAASELALLPEARVIFCLGAFAWSVASKLRLSFEPEPPRVRFAHRAVSSGATYTLLGCYHPSQQNTFTGRLTEAMIDEALSDAKRLAGLDYSS